MTMVELLVLERRVRAQKLQIVEGHPIAFAIQRAKFKKAGLEMLVKAAESVADSNRIRLKVASWQRQIRKLDKKIQRFHSILEVKSRRSETSLRVKKVRHPNSVINPEDCRF